MDCQRGMIPQYVLQYCFELFNEKRCLDFCNDTLYGYVQAFVCLPILFQVLGLVPATSSSADEGHREEKIKEEKKKERGVNRRLGFNSPEKKFDKGITFNILSKVKNLVKRVNL